MFRGILPDDYFIPLYQKITKETNKNGNLYLPYESKGKFYSTIHCMRKKLHQADPKKLKVLLSLNEELIIFENKNMVAHKFPR